MIDVEIGPEPSSISIIVDKWEMLIGFLGMGFSIALVVVVVAAAVKLGWRFWPWVLGIGALAWLFM